MLDDLKKELSSIKLLTFLLTIAVSIYLLQFVLAFLRDFSDIILILVFGWLLSFIIGPIVDLFSQRLKIPRTSSTVLTFILVAVLITAITFLFIPDVAAQLATMQKIMPGFLKNSPLVLQKAVNTFLGSFNNYISFIPSVAQFAVNIVTVLILSFYLTVEKNSINKKLFAMTPKSWHANMHLFQKVIDQTFASFVRVQIIWGAIGGIVTWIVLTIFGVKFAASTSLLAGILSAIPVIGPIIGVIPPVLVSLIDEPSKVLLIFLIIFLIQQFIFNVFGPKIVGRAFQINPIVVLLALLVGIKIAGLTGAIFAIPVVSIGLIVGREFYAYYFKEKET